MNGYRTGIGFYEWSNGNQYEGEFLYNTQNGKGIFNWNNGDKYEGDFVNNFLQGFGLYSFYNGDKYEGDYVSGVKQGQGKYTFASGLVKEGKWVNDKFVSSNANNNKVSQVNNSYSSSESNNNNNNPFINYLLGGNVLGKLADSALNALDSNSHSSASSNTSTSSQFNAYQCSHCAFISKGTSEPANSAFNNCIMINYSRLHSWNKINTNGHGKQCSNCGIKYYGKETIVSGSLGECANGRANGHNWVNF